MSTGSQFSKKTVSYLSYKEILISSVKNKKNYKLKLPKINKSTIIKLRLKRVKLRRKIIK